VLYVRREWQDRIEPVEFGWTNTAHFADYSSRDLTLRADAGRYECGTLNTIGCFGLQAALELILEADPARIAPLILARADEIAAGALAKGYEILGDRRPDAASGIVSVRHPSLDGRLIVRELRDKGIIVAPRQGWIRFSPHFYTSPDDIAKVVEALP
jgi:selenocysteine lyase/cysteine desulfurase